MPMDSFSTPHCLRQLFQQRKMRAGVFVGRRDAHQAFDRQAVNVAAALDESHGFARVDAGFLFFKAGVDLHEKLRMALPVF